MSTLYKSKRWLIIASGLILSSPYTGALWVKNEKKTAVEFVLKHKGGSGTTAAAYSVADHFNVAANNKLCGILDSITFEDKKITCATSGSYNKHAKKKTVLFVNATSGKKTISVKERNAQGVETVLWQQDIEPGNNQSYSFDTCALDVIKVLENSYVIVLAKSVS
ncbi:MAG: hypothetical protein WBQ73_03480 [Candidatus Babeliales bacterium]